MSLDVSLRCEHCGSLVFEANITHNLVKMAEKAGIYTQVWRPEEMSILYAHELISPLRSAIEYMRENPALMKRFNPPNNWGSYEEFVSWLEEYLEACEKWPETRVEVSR